LSRAVVAVVAVNLAIAAAVAVQADSVRELVYL
jgi:hypothetical protein